MSVTSAGLRDSGRPLTSHDTSHQSSLPLALRDDTIERGSGLPFTTSYDLFLSHGSPRLPTVATRTRTARSGAESAQVRSKITYPRSGSPVSDDSPGSRESPADLSDDDYGSPRRVGTGPVRSAKSHSRRQPPGHIPRPRNAFILYRSWYVRQGFLANVENDHREISRIVGKIWKGLPDTERNIWKDNAEREKEAHMLRYPDYKYSPNSRRDGAPAPIRSAPARTPTARTRKPKPEAPSEDRLDDIATAFLSGSRRHSLTDRVRALHEQRKARELEVNPKRAAPALVIRVPPRSSQFGAEADDSPQLSPHSSNLSSNSSNSASLATPSPQFQATQDGEDSQWSLAACSVPLQDPVFAPDCTAGSVSSILDFDSDLARAWPFRHGFSGSEPLNAIVSQDDPSIGYGSPSSSTHYHQYTVTEEQEPLSYVSSETSPFNRILEETQQAYMTSDGFDSFYGTLPADPALLDMYWSQFQPSALARNTESCAGAHTNTPEDMSMLFEWCTPSSPVFTDGSATTASVSGGVPTPPVCLEYPVPAYPPRSTLLCGSWPAGAEDLDAYKSVVGSFRDERDHMFDLGAEPKGARI